MSRFRLLLAMVLLGTFVLSEPDMSHWISLIPSPIAGAGGSSEAPTLLQPATDPPDPADASPVTPSMQPSVGGPVVYVSGLGSDDAEGSAERPWRTLQYAVDHAPVGSTIEIAPGEFAGCTVTRSGLTIKGTSPGTILTGSGNVVTFSGVTSGEISHVEVRGAAVPFAAGIRVEASRGVVIQRSVLHHNQSFGIRVVESTDITIRDNDIYKNETGIELSRGGDRIVIDHNTIHDNDRMVTASRGGNAIVFHLTTGAVSVTRNEVWGNRAPTGSGYDGGAFEVYGASNLSISDNTLWDNNNALETGTDGPTPCSGNQFLRNIVMGQGSVANETEGMILRCADRMLVAQNTFDGLDTFAFYVTASGPFAGTIDGLRIINNIVIRGRVHSLAEGLPPDLVIDYNVLDPGGSSAAYGWEIAFVEGLGGTSSLDIFRTWTGFEGHGMQADPGLVAPSSGDYHLRPDSPVIDAGTDFGQPFAGAAPDPGRFEYQP